MALKIKCPSLQEAFLDHPFTSPFSPSTRLVVCSSLCSHRHPCFSSTRTLMILGYNYQLSLFSLLDCEVLKTMDSVIFTSLSSESSHSLSQKRDQGMFKQIILKCVGFCIYRNYTCQILFNLSPHLWLRAHFVVSWVYLPNTLPGPKPFPSCSSSSLPGWQLFIPQVSARESIPLIRLHWLLPPSNLVSSLWSCSTWNTT